MCPMVERIAQRMRDSSRPGLELGKGFSVSRAKWLGHAVGTHRPPFVMVAFKPNFRQIFELAVLSDISGRQMTMVVQNRLRLGKLVVQTPCGARLQKKIPV